MLESELHLSHSLLKRVEKMCIVLKKLVTAQEEFSLPDKYEKFRWNIICVYLLHFHIMFLSKSLMGTTAFEIGSVMSRSAAM